jgi:hypothetical protein
MDDEADATIAGKIKPDPRVCFRWSRHYAVVEALLLVVCWSLRGRQLRPMSAKSHVQVRIIA